jgi:hypothetical protein
MRIPNNYFSLTSLVAAIFLMGTFGFEVSAAEKSGPFPRWDRKINGASRFKVLSAFENEAVLDQETGLVWETSPSGPCTNNFVQAALTCNNITKGNRKGWRLPSIQELGSLVNPSASTSLLLPDDHPFLNVQPMGYWSSTNRLHSNGHWVQRFTDGQADTTAPLNELCQWCVRGGSGADEQ